jgi:hypothetical protein
MYVKRRINMSYFVNEDLVKRAVDMVRPMIDKLLGSDITGGRPNLHLVVMVQEEEKIIYQESFGEDRTTWKHQFDIIARKKAYLCKRTGMVARSVRNNAPWLYKIGDTRYVGGVIENGLIVAASGVQDHFDEMISWIVLSAIQGVCRDEMARIDDTANCFE